MKSYTETLTEEEVEQIRWLANNKVMTIAQIAHRFNTEMGHVRYIASNEKRKF